jgi:hypothetical protein
MADLNVIYRIAADISGLQSGVDRAAKATEGLEGMAGRLQGVLEKAFTVAAVAKLTSDVVHFASALSDLSQQTGISTTDLQKFDLAFAASGVSMETVATNATKLSKALVEGDTSTVGALQKLGLNVKELKAQNPGDTFLEVADAIGKIPNPTEKAWVALQVFGKGGAELLKGLTGNLKETTDQFEKLGLIVDEHTVKAIDDFGDQMGLLGKALIAVLAQIVGPLMPALTELTNILLFLGKIVGDLVGFIVRGLVEALLLVASPRSRCSGNISASPPMPPNGSARTRKRSTPCSGKWRWASTRRPRVRPRRRAPCKGSAKSTKTPSGP